MLLWTCHNSDIDLTGVGLSYSNLLAFYWEKLAQLHNSPMVPTMPAKE